MIRLGRFTDPTVLPNEPLITAMTLAERSVGPLVAHDERERAAWQAHLQQAKADFDQLPFDAAAARAFGQVAASLRHAGRKTAARAYDAMVGSQALAERTARLHGNADNFNEIDGLEVVAVPDPLA